ncbi:MAG: hypothetical protein AB7O86_05885 [Porticoccaceae bacterium]
MNKKIITKGAIGTGVTCLTLLAAASAAHAGEENFTVDCIAQQAHFHVVAVDIDWTSNIRVKLGGQTMLDKTAHELFFSVPLGGHVEVNYYDPAPDFVDHGTHFVTVPGVNEACPEQPPFVPPTAMLPKDSTTTTVASAVPSTAVASSTGYVPVPSTTTSATTTGQELPATGHGSWVAAYVAAVLVAIGGFAVRAARRPKKNTVIF